MRTNTSNQLRSQKIAYSALYLAIALVLPFLTGQIPQIGSMLCPMHLPALLCGFTCGWPWGVAVGFLAPLLRSVMFGMPPMFPTALAMAFELAVYGGVAGILYKKLPHDGSNGGQSTKNLYRALITAMVCGRLVWGAVRFVFAGLSATKFSLEAFMAGAIFNAVPGIILQLILVPVLVSALKRAGLVLNK